jgi:hypothetical protein
MWNRSLLYLLLGLLCAGPCRAHDPNHVEGSGVMVTVKREVADFTNVQLDGAFAATITCQGKKQVEITGDDNIVPLVKTEVKEGLLHVYAEKSFSTKQLLKVAIGMQVLDKLVVSGANDVQVDKVKSAALQIDASGSSIVTVTGKVKSLSSELSGAANLNAGKLEAETVGINISGAGNADVHASQKLDARIMGAGAVVYGGNPKDVSRQVMGAGSIEPR